MGAGRYFERLFSSPCNSCWRLIKLPRQQLQTFRRGNQCFSVFDPQVWTCTTLGFHPRDLLWLQGEGVQLLKECACNPACGNWTLDETDALSGKFDGQESCCTFDVCNFGRGHCADTVTSSYGFKSFGWCGDLGPIIGTTGIQEGTSVRKSVSWTTPTPTKSHSITDTQDREDGQYRQQQQKLQLHVLDISIRISFHGPTYKSDFEKLMIQRKRYSFKDIRLKFLKSTYWK